MNESVKFDKEHRDAIAILESACSAYVNWYNNGRSMDAGDMAYAMVSDVRQALAAIKSAPTAATDISDAEDDAKRLHGDKMRYLDALLTVKLRTGYILNYSRDLHHARLEAEEVRRVIDNALGATQVASPAKSRAAEPSESEPRGTSTVASAVADLKPGIEVAARYCEEVLAVNHPHAANYFRHAATNIRENASTMQPTAAHIGKWCEHTQQFDCIGPLAECVAGECQRSHGGQR